MKPPLIRTGQGDYQRDYDPRAKDAVAPLFWLAMGLAAAGLVILLLASL